MSDEDTNITDGVTSTSRESEILNESRDSGVKLLDKNDTILIR